MNNMGIVALVLLSAAANQAHAMPTTYGAYGFFFDEGDGMAMAGIPDEFAITNTSDAGVQIAWITIDISGSSNNPVFDTIDGCSPNYCYGTNLGSPITETAGDPVGFVPVADQSVYEESTSITLNFTDFGAGETFNFTVDLDEDSSITGDSGFRLTGFEFQGATLTVGFTGAIADTSLAGVWTQILGDPLYDADVSLAAVAPVPLPTAVLLMLGATGVLGAFRRRK